LGGVLLPFQAEAVKFGLEHGGKFLLGDEMGLGKTVTALALARQYMTEWPVLVVAPAPLCIVWQEHALTWLAEDLGPQDVTVVRSSSDSPPKGTKMLIVSYNLISEGKFQRRPCDGKDWAVVILDECHMLRGAKSQRSQAAIPLAHR
ncbi:unnamed protein product, partial [Polarella glacialis]